MRIIHVYFSVRNGRDRKFLGWCNICISNIYDAILYPPRYWPIAKSNVPFSLVDSRVNATRSRTFRLTHSLSSADHSHFDVTTTRFAICCFVHLCAFVISCESRAMSSKRLASSPSTATPNHPGKMVTIAERIKMLDRLREGVCYVWGCCTLIRDEWIQRFLHKEERKENKRQG